MLEILKQLKSLTGNFTHPFMNRRDVLLRLETLVKAVSAIAASATHCNPSFESPFTLRDIRRTAETRLVDFGITKETDGDLLVRILVENRILSAR